MRFLIAYLPITLLVLALLVTGIVTYLVILYKRARKAGAKAEAEPPEAAGEPTEAQAERRRRAISPEPRSSFTAGFQRLKRQAFGRDYRYGVPWLLLIGQSGSRRHDFLARAGLSLPLGPPDERELARETGCRWWFFDRGIVLDPAGEYVLRADGDTADAQGWRALLRLLQKHRPKRPIDGVVLTLSCRELMAIARGGTQAVAEAEQKAARLYERLREAQKQLGLRFPVYLLVTGCEEIPGFDSFSSELPERLRHEMFGWSSPYSVEISYRTEWADEAFEHLKHSLDQVQLEMFAQVSEVAEPDDVFLFPDNVMALREPLRAYLDQLFKPIAYHESMLFRGIYLCGSEGPADVRGVESEGVGTVEPAPERAGPRATYFLKDLLERKVFVEAGLGGPTGATLVERNKRVRLAWAGLAVAALVIGFGISYAYDSLRERARSLQGVLERTAADVDAFRYDPVPCGRVGERGLRVVDDPSLARLRVGATRYLTSLGNLDAKRFDSVFIPYSWWPGSFNGRLKRSFTEAYDVIVFEAMCKDLENRALRAASGRLGAPSAALPRLPERTSFAAADFASPIEDLPEFRALERYLEALTELEENARRYNDIERTRNLDDVDIVATYLFGDLPKGFLSDSYLYDGALDGIRYAPFQFPPYRRQATAHADELMRSLYERLFDENELRLALETLAAELRALGSRQFFDTGRLNELVDLVNQIDRGLAEPALLWIFREPFDLGLEFDGLRAMMDRSLFLGRELARGRSFSDEYYEEGRIRWQRLRSRLAGYSGAGLTGSLLKQATGRPIPELNEEVEVFKGLLEDFLNQSFVTSDDGRRAIEERIVTVDLQRNRIRWDANLLRSAVATYEPYQRFVETGLDYLGAPQLQSSLRIIARRQLDNTLVELILQSLSQESLPESLLVTPELRERELRDQIARFSEAVTPLTQILGILQDSQLQETQQELGELLALQSWALLSEVDRILAEEPVYRPRSGSFEWWDGRAPLALEAYSVRDPEELAAYLAQQRGRVATLAEEFAKPLVTMLGRTGNESQRELLVKWDTILEQLNGYREKEPGNSIAALEELISKQFGEVRLENCFDTAQEDVLARGGSTGDFFRDQQLFLRDRLYLQCFQKVGERAAAGFREIASFFNGRLRDRFPFALALDDIRPVEADPATLREFFRLFDREKKIILEAKVDSPAFTGLGQEIHSFVGRMAQIRKLLAGFLDDPAAGPLPVVDFEVEFRVNRQAETCGDQVIEWRLDTPQRVVVHPAADPRVRWTLGDKLALSLRWARGSPWNPVRDQAGAGVEIVDRTAVFRHENLWSLVSLVRSHPSSGRDFLSAKDDQPHTLRFTIAAERDPEVPLPVGAETRCTGKANLFVRIRLVSGDEEPLQLPRFPVAAPELPPLESDQEASR